MEDANSILPRQDLLQYAHGSYALGSDIFRYELQSLGQGIWIDTDIYFLKPIEIDSDIIFGWQDKGLINGAVLYFAPNTKILKWLQDFVSSEPVVAPWWSKEEQEEQRRLYLSGQHKTLENLPWGTIGPNAITYFAKLLELEKFAQPQEVFYPVHWTDAHKMFEPNFPYGDFITEKTLTVHL